MDAVKTFANDNIYKYTDLYPFGTTTSDIFTLLCLFATVSSLTLDRQAYADLSQVPQCSSINNMAGNQVLLGLFGLTLCILRLTVHGWIKKTPEPFQLMVSKWFDLVFGLILWILFIIAMASAVSYKNSLNNNCASAASPSPTPAVTDVYAKSLISDATSCANAELGWAVTGFLLTTGFTVWNVLEVVAPHQQNYLFDDAKQ